MIHTDSDVEYISKESISCMVLKFENSAYKEMILERWNINNSGVIKKYNMKSDALARYMPIASTSLLCGVSKYNIFQTFLLIHR
jgi:hypothetical protein